MKVPTLKLNNNTDEMEGHKYKMTILVGKINRMNDENRKLNTMLKRMSSSYNDLQKHIRSLVENKQQLTRPSRSQIFIPDDQSKRNFELRILSPKSADVDSDSAVSHQSYHSSDCYERLREKEAKNAKFMEDQELPSKKRKINYILLDQIQKGSSSLDDSKIGNESPNRKHKALSKCSGEETAAPPKRIVSVGTRTEASVISDGCQWLKYGQKMTSNNPYPRSYYKCAMAPRCPVKRQVQRCAEDPTTVITTYKGDHTHSLSPLAMVIMRAGLSNQLIGEGLNRENFLAENHFMHFSTARISTPSPFPTITLDLTDNQPNPGLHSHLGGGKVQRLTPLPHNMGHVFDWTLCLL